MVDLVKYQALRHLYLKNPGKRTRLFHEFFRIFNFDKHWVCKVYKDYQTKLDLKANFIIALDEIVGMELEPDDLESEFSKAFSKVTRHNIEMNRGLHYSLKHMIKRFRDPATRDMDNDELKYFKVLRGLSGLSTENVENLYEQEHHAMAMKVQDFMVERFGEQTYYDCVSHFVFGESFSDIAYYDGTGLSRQGMRWRLTKAWEALRKYLTHE